MKFTFKTIKATGPYSAFFPDHHHHIKYNKVQVGTINDKHPHKIRLQVVKNDINEDGNPNCLWKWIQLAHESNSIAEAKEFLNLNIDVILKHYNLHIEN